jgi:para-aminobenzoate synthetase component 2
VQFHPESVLTEGGHQLLANWLLGCGDADAVNAVPALAAAIEKQRAAAS